MAYIYKRGKTWTARITKRIKVPEKQKDGTFKPKPVLKQTSKGGFRTKAEAKQYAIEQENQQLHGIDIKQDPVFADYFKKWYETYKFPSVGISARRNYENDQKLLKLYFGYKKIKDITRQDYQRFINWIGSDRAKSTVEIINCSIRACVGSAIDDGLIFRNFTNHIKLNGDASKKIKYLNLNEIKRLKKELMKARNPAYTSTYLILAALYTGARLGELSALHWSDISFETSEISITKSWNENRRKMSKTKTPSSVRIIKVNKWLLNLLSELKINHNDFIFATKRTGLPPTSCGVNDTLRYYLHKAGINKPGYHFHSLRHSHVAYLRSQGIKWEPISKRLGHANIEVTIKTYAYLMDEDRDKQEDKIVSSLDKLNK